MSQLKLSLLGSPQVAVDKKQVTVESRKALALLFYLAVTGERHSRDHLATLLWPDQDQSRARRSLRQVLWLLKKEELAPWLDIERDALGLADGYWCDVEQFQVQIEAGALAEALALYRDEFLMGFTLRDCPDFDRWQFLQADELRRLLASALATLMQQCAGQGDYETALDHARRWLSLDPLLESVHRHLMRLHALAGQQAVALRQYEECVRILDEELGVPPEAETTALYEAIRTRTFSPPDSVSAERHRQTGIGDTAPVPVSAASPPQRGPISHNLPPQLTPFIGRKSEVAELERLVADDAVRLITISGFGGIGKTRLALQVAQRFAENSSSLPIFPQGILFVPLSAVDGTGGIISAIAEAGGFTFYSNEAPRQQLLDYLRDKKLLLLLDNFEHLLASAALVADILAAAPGIKILVTSREPLHLQGEWHWSVAGLPVPESEVDEEMLLAYDAVHLFVQSARRVQPNFSLLAEHKEVVRICQLVGGMPLAIELAAAWIKMVPCVQIASEIERNLAFLSTRLRNVPDRHRSMQVVFEHSWQLLAPAEQEVFQQLSIFRGGFYRDAAEQIASASWMDLIALVEKSLLSVGPDGRYQIHELLRQFAGDKLQADPAAKEAVMERYCAYYVNFLAQRLPAMNGGQQKATAAEIEADLDNVRSAWVWAVDQQKTVELQKAAQALYLFHQFQRRYQEGEGLWMRAVQRLEDIDPSRQRDLALAQLLTDLGWFRVRLGHLERAQTVLERSHALYTQHQAAPPPTGMATDPLNPLGVLAILIGDYEEAARLGRQVHHLSEERSDAGNLMFAHYVLTSAYLAQGHYLRAQNHAQQAHALADAAQNRWFLAYCLNEWGTVARAMGNHAEAKNHFQASYAIKEEFEDPEGMAVALNHLGEIATLQSDYADALGLYQKSLAIYAEINDRGGLAASLKGLGQVAWAQRDDPTAREQFSQALAIATDMQFWPLVFSILLDVSELLMQTGAPALGIEVLTLVQRQPGSNQETKVRADDHLKHWQEQVDSDLFAKAANRGAERKLETVTTAVFAELATASES